MQTRSKNSRSLKKRILSLGSAAIIMAMTVTAGAAELSDTSVGTVNAAVTGVESGILLATDYPGVTVTPGTNLSFSLDLTNSTGVPADTELKEVSVPDGWSGYFKGGSNEITHFYAKINENEGAATYYLQVPNDAAAGDYEAVISAVTGDASSELKLNITISEQESGTSELTTEYAEQEGASGTSFSFTSTIQNSSPEAQSYSLSAEVPAAGWSVKIVPSGESTQIASIDVDGQSSQGLSITVTPPETVEAGEYTIPISAISATEKLSTELSITITGTYSISLATPSSLLSFSAEANKKTAVTIDITNNGNIDLQNVNLVSSAPTDWVVEYSESTIDVLEAGTTKEITAYVTPASNALSGDYQLSMTASSEETTSSAVFRVSVKTATTWGVVGIALIAVVILCLVFVIKKFGRR